MSSEDQLYSVYMLRILLRLGKNAHQVSLRKAFPCLHIQCERSYVHLLLLAETDLLLCCSGLAGSLIDFKTSWKLSCFLNYRVKLELISIQCIKLTSVLYELLKFHIRHESSFTHLWRSCIQYRASSKAVNLFMEIRCTVKNIVFETRSARTPVNFILKRSRV